MKNKGLVKEIINWCADNHTESFCVTFDYSGHVEQLSVCAISGGYNTPRETLRKAFYSDSAAKGDILCIFQAIKLFKEEHDEWYSVDSMKRVKEFEIKTLKAKLKVLGVDCE